MGNEPRLGVGLSTGGPRSAVLMSRLIEVQQVENCSSPLVVRVGDVLLIQATGCRVRDGGQAVELWGPFLSAVVAVNGAVWAGLMGPPKRGPGPGLVSPAQRPWSCSLETLFRLPRNTTLGLTVEP